MCWLADWELVRRCGGLCFFEVREWESVVGRLGMEGFWYGFEGRALWWDVDERGWELG